jgi:hypothetical protein
MKVQKDDWLDCKKKILDLHLPNFDNNMSLKSKWFNKQLRIYNSWNCFCTWNIGTVPLTSHNVLVYFQFFGYFLIFMPISFIIMIHRYRRSDFKKKRVKFIIFLFRKHINDDNNRHERCCDKHHAHRNDNFDRDVSK